MLLYIKYHFGASAGFAWGLLGARRGRLRALRYFSAHRHHDLRNTGDEEQRRANTFASLTDLPTGRNVLSSIDIADAVHCLKFEIRDTFDRTMRDLREATCRTMRTNPDGA